MEELEEYEEYEELNYNRYVTIVFGLRHNVKYCRFRNNKIEAFTDYYQIYNNNNFCFSECDSRSYNLKVGKSILNGFDNDIGLITIIGLDDIDKIYCYFDKDRINISDKFNILYVKNIELSYSLVVNKLKGIKICKNIQQVP
jgi:2-hydroxy-3-keto-5-methylthiopentenyl-1-phosphate phosphatase